MCIDTITKKEKANSFKNIIYNIHNYNDLILQLYTTFIIHLASFDVVKSVRGMGCVPPPTYLSVFTSHII